MKIVITCGGTGGHVFPALAVAEQFSWDELVFIGGSKRLEKKLIEEKGYQFHAVATSRRNPLTIFLGTVQSFFKLKKIKPDVVFSTGGYITFPVAVAAFLRRIPIVLHEQNFVPGRVNRVIGKFAKKIAVSFEDSKKYFGGKCVFTGLPVRREIIDNFRTERLLPFRTENPTILIMGGSQGAQAIDDLVFKMNNISWKWLHLHKNNFRSDMNNVYQEADLAVCRAGASTLFELAAVGLPAILIPYPYAADNHQLLNAEDFAKKGAAVVLLTKDLCENSLKEKIENLVNNVQQLKKMSQAMHSLASPNAAQKIAELIKGR